MMMAAKKKKKKVKTPKKKKAPKKPSSVDGVTLQKTQWNIYTTMLLISLLSMILACVLLKMELGRYEEPTSGRTNFSSSAVVSVEMTCSDRIA